ncbi:MAG TPA: hypothetical protein VFW67_12440 [Burkholderiaceae bacterium]|nr:hypothetical protein [Burkholderiaceae bacterium]
METFYEVMRRKGILAVVGNLPLDEDGMFRIQSGKPNPTKATPIHKVITDKPIIKVPG